MTKEVDKIVQRLGQLQKMTEANTNNSKSQASDIEQLAISNISYFVQSNDDALYSKRLAMSVKYLI